MTLPRAWEASLSNTSSADIATWLIRSLMRAWISGFLRFSGPWQSGAVYPALLAASVAFQHTR